MDFPTPNLVTGENPGRLNLSLMKWESLWQHQTNSIPPTRNLRKASPKVNGQRKCYTSPLSLRLSFPTRGTETGRQNSKRDLCTTNRLIQEGTFSLQSSDDSHLPSDIAASRQNHQRGCSHNKWPVIGSIFVLMCLKCFSCPKTLRQLGRHLRPSLGNLFYPLRQWDGWKD